VKRVYIPKPGKKERRPLGIPTVLDRGKQALAKLALEPQLEAYMEPNSFGFRPARKAMDATWRIRHKFKYGAMYVYDADVEKCFDRISHEALLTKLQVAHPILQRQIQAWLEAGIFENGRPFPSSGSGTPQGGVISPLLANWALDGMQAAIYEAVYTHVGNQKQANQVLYIRYADDFVILSPQIEWLQAAIAAAKRHLERVGLNINEGKTRVIHTVDRAVDGPQGRRIFDFLGFTFSQRRVSRHKRLSLGGKKPRTTQLVPAVLPTKAQVKRHMEELREAMTTCTSSLALIRKLNPIIRGWRNYYKFSDARTYTRLPSDLDMRLYRLIRHWIRPRFNKYGRPTDCWTSQKGYNWVFYARDPATGKLVYLERSATVSWSLKSYNRIDASRSPYDGDLSYWSQHANSSYFQGVLGGNERQAYLLKKHQGKCASCKQGFHASEFAYAQVDHIRPKSQGGSQAWTN